MNKVQRKDSWEQFFEYWEKEADALRSTMLAPSSCETIHLKLMSDYLDQKAFVHRGGFDPEIHTRYRLLESKLTTSLQIAKTKYLDKHPPLPEKFVDAIGNLINKSLKREK
jgi:hypothetical protein